MIDIGEQAGLPVLNARGDSRTADPEFEQLFRTEFVRMQRLAALLGADDPENVAQEAFLRLHKRWGRLSDIENATGYLRTVLVNLTRSRHRHLRIVARHTQPSVPAAASAEESVLEREEHRAVLRALNTLSARHREALVLRYWLELSEKEMATAMGTSAGTVKSHVSRGLSALRKALDE